MTPRERIIATLCRQPVDRAPVDIWCTPEVLDGLRKYTGESDELAVYKSLGVDKIAWIFPGYGEERHFDPNDSQGQNIWGVPTRKTQAGLATYQEYGTPPLGGYDGIKQLADYPSWPNPARFNMTGAALAAQKARMHDFATIGPWISHFEIYCQMRGLENALMDIAANPDFLEAALDKIDSIQTAMLERMLDALGDLIDIVFISDDMGTQGNLLMSPDAWERHFKRRLGRWCDLAHAHGKKVLYHSDGAIRPLIARLIEAGVDILNPIQHVCPGMEMKSLKREFGGRVMFHGGVENQNILPRGAAAAVASETRACLESLGAGGGYICCSCHNMQAGTPVDNILAMIETARS
jgi:uroporphyrinogen decarboxylase